MPVLRVFKDPCSKIVRAPDLKEISFLSYQVEPGKEAISFCQKTRYVDLNRENSFGHKILGLYNTTLETPFLVETTIQSLHEP